MTTRQRQRRPILLTSLTLAVLLAGWLVLEVLRALTATHGPLVDYAAEIEHLIAEPQPSGAPNAWPQLVEATELLAQIKDERTALAEEENWYDTWSDPNRIPWNFLSVYRRDSVEEPGDEVMRKASIEAIDVLRERGLFDRTAELAEARRFVRPMAGWNDWLTDFILPELGRCRELARAQAARMHLARRAGNGAEVVAAFEETLALGAALSRQGTLIDHIVGIAIQALALGELRRQLIEDPHPPQTLRALLDVIQRHPLGPLTTSLEGERRILLDVIQRTHTAGGRLILTELETLQGGPKPPRIINVLSILHPSREETTRLANRFYDAAIRQARLRRAERDSATLEGLAPDDVQQWNQRLLSLMLPALDKAISSRDQITMERAGMRLMLAVEIHRAAEGATPQTLRQLLPNVLAELPVDPYAPDGQFRFRRLDPAEDSHARDYLLYSVAHDQQDHGGRIHPEGRFRALQEEGAGFDYVVNAPD